jgi:hypothetical protein
MLHKQSGEAVHEHVSLHRGFYKFIPQLAIDSEFFHCVFANPYKTKGAVKAVCA